MRNLHRNDDGTFSAKSGSNIRHIIEEVIIDTKLLNEDITFEFNGVIITVTSNSKANLIYRDYQRALSGCIDRNVGPYPSETLSEEELAKDARILAEDKERIEQGRAKRRAEAKREALEARLPTTPEMELSDPEGWAKFIKETSVNPSIVTYLHCWARLMQQEMNAGAKLEDIAKDTSHDADIHGLSGNGYSTAIGILAQYWKYGDQLRRWHNTKFGTPGEKANEIGGTFNPATLSIS